MLTPSLPTEASTGLPLSARRRIQAGLITASAAGVPRSGVLAASSPLLVTGTTDTSMRYRIAPFVGASSRDGIGVEFVANDASDTVGTDVAPSSNSRIDVIWFRCRFPSLTDTGQTAPLFGVTRGIPNANPQKPTNVPAGAEELATAVVTSTDLNTQTVVITNTFRWTAMAGGIVPLRSKAEMDAWNPADGSAAYRIDLGARADRENGAWAYTESGTVTWAESFYTNHTAYEPLKLTRRGTRARLRGAFTTTGAVPFAANTVFTVANIPDGYRPVAGSDGFCPIVFSGTSNVWGWARVTSAGQLQMWLSAASASSAGANGMVVSVDMEWARA